MIRLIHKATGTSVSTTEENAEHLIANGTFELAQQEEKKPVRRTRAKAETE